MQVLGKEQPVEVLPHLVAGHVAGDHMISERPGLLVAPPSGDLHLQPIRLHIHSRGNQSNAIRNLGLERLAAVHQGARIRRHLVGLFPQLREHRIEERLQRLR